MAPTSSRFFAGLSPELMMRVLAALPNPCQIMGLCNRDINQTFVTELNLVGDPDKLVKEICDGFYGSPFIDANGLTKARAIGMAWKDGRQLQFMLGFQNDRDVALVAVRQHGAALQYASRSLRSDEEVIHAAVQQNPSARRFAL